MFEFCLLSKHRRCEGLKFVYRNRFETYDDDVTATLVSGVDDVPSPAFDLDGSGNGRRNSSTCGSGACSI